MNPLASFTDVADSWWMCVLHSTWQSSLVALVAFALVWLRRKRSASFLYAVLIVALLKFLVPPIIEIPVLGSPVAFAPAVEVSVATRTNTDETRTVSTAVPASASVPPSTTPQRATAPENAGLATNITVPAAELPLAQSSPAVAPDPAFSITKHWKTLLALLHLTGAGLLALVMAGSYLHLRRLLRAAQPANEELSSLANDVAACLRLRRPVAVLLTSTPCAPMATGLFKRRMLLPEALTTLDDDEMRGVLAHELAHHRRMDLAFIWVEHVVTLLWWFNPLVWVLVRAIHRKREDCCDDVVLSLDLAANTQYCKTLLHAAKRLHRPFAPHLVFGCASKLHPLGQRITRIMDTAIRRRAALTAGGVVVVALMGLVLLPTFLPVAADAVETPADTDPTRTDTDAIPGTGQAPSGNVLRFDGQDDSVFIPSSPSLDITSDVTVSAWARVDAGIGDVGAVLFRGDSRPSLDPYSLSVNRNRMQFDINFGDHGAKVSAPVDREWHHWAGVRDAAQSQLYLYMDGECVSQVACAGEIGYDTANMTNEIGSVDQGHWGPWGYFKGDVDQISVWNVARKPEDIQREVNEGIKPDEPGLIALWTFDEEGQTISDSSPSNIFAMLGTLPESDANDPVRVAADAAPSQAMAAPVSDPRSQIEEEIAAHYAKADAEVQEYIRWTASNFGRGGLWFAHDAYAPLTAQEREAKIVRLVEALQGEYGRHLCSALAEAGALKDARLLPGLIKAASYHREDSDYDCRPKWMAVAALGRQDEVSAVPTLIPLVDHGNTNTRMWARASLVRLTGQNFNDDKQAWGAWWNDSGNEPKIDLAQLKPWTPPSQVQATAPPSAPVPPSSTLQSATVPPESQAVVDALPGEIVFHGTYFHRSRGSDLSAPSVVWIKRTNEGETIAASYLPAFNDTSVAYMSPDKGIRRYEGHYHGRNGQAPSARNLDMAHGEVTLSHEGGEKDGATETLTVPPTAIFMPNSRPDPYTAHMGIAAFQAAIGLPVEPAELLCYDWDNSGTGMASYTIRMENKGKEEVTVPAGTFSATHYVETHLTFGDTWYKKRPGHVTDYWVLDNGVIVRILRHREPYELQLLSVETPAELPGRMEGSTKAPAGKLTILSAVYGAQDSWIDLTEVLNRMIQNDTLKVRVSNELGGDPIYGVEKKLNVHYRVGEKTYVTSIDELGTLRLPESHAAQPGSSGALSDPSRSVNTPPSTRAALDRAPSEVPVTPVLKDGDTVVLDRNKVAEELASQDYAEVVTNLNPQMAEDENGNVTGIISDHFASVPLASQIGLRNGDVVNTVNGIQIDSDQRLMEIMQKFGNASMFRLGVTRNGEPVVLTFQLQ